MIQRVKRWTRLRCGLLIPSLTGSGTSVADSPDELVHGQEFLVSGVTGLGSKASNVRVFDNCSGDDPLDLWDGALPNTAAAQYNGGYRTPADADHTGNVDVPHPNITQYYCGCHIGASFSSGYNVGVWLNTAIQTRPFFVVSSWWERADPDWVFTGQSQPDQNYKLFAVGDGGTPYAGNIGYLEYMNGQFDNADDPIPLDTNDWGGSVYYTTNNGNPATQEYARLNPTDWIYHDAVLQVSNTVGNFWYTQNAYPMSPLRRSSGFFINLDSDLYATTGTLSAGPVGFARAYQAASANNWRYQADMYVDIGPNPARLYLTDNAVFASSTKLALQPWVTGEWNSSGTSAVFECNKGQLDAGTVYLHLRNEVDGHQMLGTRVMS